MKTVVGIVTFAGLEFTKLAVKSVEETVKEHDYEICIIVGKPGDTATATWASSRNFPHFVHDTNYGFPYSVNDLYDFTWKQRGYNNLVVMGNDVIAYPYAIDTLIEVADTTKYEWVCARECDVKSLCNGHPEQRKYFKGGDYIFIDYNARPWEAFTQYDKNIVYSEGSGLCNVHNLAIFQRSVFDKIGYIDVNFYPAYYEDNDYARRAVNANIVACTPDNAWYFHFWSRTIKQGTGGSTSKQFRNNRKYYIIKWGADFGKEKYKIPFDNKIHTLTTDVNLKPSLKIADRAYEKAAINYWKRLGG